MHHRFQAPVSSTNAHTASVFIGNSQSAAHYIDAVVSLGASAIVIGTKPEEFEVDMAAESNKSILQTIRYSIDSTERQSHFFRHVSPMLARQQLILSVPTLQKLLTLQVCEGLNFFDNTELEKEISDACTACRSIDMGSDKDRYMSKLQVAQKLIIVAAMVELNKCFFDFARTLMPGTLRTMCVKPRGGPEDLRLQTELSNNPKEELRWNYQLKTWCDIIQEPMHHVANREALSEAAPRSVESDGPGCGCFSDGDCFPLHRIWRAFLASKHAPKTQLTRFDGAHPYYGFVAGATTSHLSAILLPTVDHSSFGLQSLGEHNGILRTGGIAFSPTTKAPHLMQDAAAHMV